MRSHPNALNQMPRVWVGFLVEASWWLWCIVWFTFLTGCQDPQTGLYEEIQGFGRKIKIVKRHTLQNNVFHFPYLANKNVKLLKKYAEYLLFLLSFLDPDRNIGHQKIKEYLDNLFNQYQYYSKFEQTSIPDSMKMFPSPFNIDVDAVREDFQTKVFFYFSVNLM